MGDAVARLAAGRTTLMIVHDVRLALAADRVVRLDGGRVAGFRTHDGIGDVA